LACGDNISKQNEPW